MPFMQVPSSVGSFKGNPHNKGDWMEEGTAAVHIIVGCSSHTEGLREAKHRVYVVLTDALDQWVLSIESGFSSSIKVW